MVSLKAPVWDGRCVDAAHLTGLRGLGWCCCTARLQPIPLSSVVTIMHVHNHACAHLPDALSIPPGPGLQDQQEPAEREEVRHLVHLMTYWNSRLSWQSGGTCGSIGAWKRFRYGPVGSRWSRRSWRSWRARRTLMDEEARVPTVTTTSKVSRCLTLTSMESLSRSSNPEPRASVPY